MLAMHLIHPVAGATVFAPECRGTCDMSERRAAPETESNAAPDLLLQGRIESDQLMGLVLAIHFPFVVILGLVTGRPIAAVIVGGLTSGIAWFLTRHRAGALATRVFVGAAFMVYSGLVIHVAGGMIEMHFHIFASLAFLTIYRDWRVPVAGAATITAHHLLFHVLQMQGVPVYVFPAGMAHGWGIVAIHAAFVVYETLVLVRITRLSQAEASQSSRLVEVAGELRDGRIVRGLRGEGGAVGTALDALGEGMDRLAQLIETIRGQAGQVADASRELARTSTSLEGASGRLGERASTLDSVVQEQTLSADEMGEITISFKAAVGQVASGAVAQAEDTERMAAAAEEMGQAIDEVVKLAREVGARAGGAVRVASEGHEVVQKAAGGMARLSEAVADASSQVRALDDQSQQISAILEVLNTIAEQTNLLALNATIEAARAGEHGKGFAVVASEVRELANRSARSASEIAEVLDAIREGVGQVARSMEEGTVLAEESATLATRAGEVFGQILSATEASAADVESITVSADRIFDRSRSLGSRIQSIAVVTQQNSQSTESMAGDSERVSHSVERIVGSVQKGAASAEAVSQEVGTVTDSATSLAASAIELDRVAEELIRSVSVFQPVQKAS